MRMLKLNLKAFRDAKSMKLRGLAITLGVTLWVATYGGYYMANESAKYSYTKIAKDLNLANLQVFITPLTKEELPKLDDIEGIKVYKKRLFAGGSVTTRNRATLQVCVVFDDSRDKAPINNLKIIAGKGFPSDSENGHTPTMLIDRTLALAHGFKVGDKVILTLYGTERELEVRGIALSPEFIFPSANPSLMIPTTGSLGIIFLPMDEVVSLFGYPLYNNLSFTFDQRHDAQKLEEAIEARLSKTRVEAFVPQRESLDQKIMNAISEGAVKFGSIALVLMFIVVFIIIYINIYRMMEERRREIGILLALGADKRSIMLYPLKMSAGYILCGSVLGLILSFALNPLFATNFLKQMDFPEVYFRYIPWFPIKGAAYSIILSSLSALLPSFRLLTLAPHQAIRGEMLASRALPSWAGSPGFGLRFGESLFLRYAFRGLLRRRTLTFATTISIALALALAVSINIQHTSVDGTMRHFFDHDPWDLVVDFGTPMDSGDIERAIPQGLIKKYEGYIKGFAQIEVNGKKALGQIIGIEANSGMRRLELLEGRQFSGMNTSEVILNKNLYKERPLKLGDQVLIETPVGRSKMDLVGIVDEVTMAIEYAYVPIGTAQEILEQNGKYTGIWASLLPGAKGPKKTLYKNDLVSMVTTKEDVQKIIDRYVVSLDAAVSSMLTMIMLLAPIFLFASTALSIIEKEKDFVILRSFGCKRREVFRIVTAEVLIVGTLGTLLSIPLAIPLGMLQNKLLSDIYFGTDTYITLSDFNYIVFCFPLFPFVAWIFSRRISGLNIVQRLMGRMG